MKAVVLGGGGFLGTHLCEALLEAGHEVRVFDRPPRGLYSHLPHFARVEWLEGDFINAQEVAAAVTGCDLVYHLVSTTLPQPSNENPVYDLETNVACSIRLFDAVRREGRARVVFVSSGGTVYGVPRSVPVEETHPTDPTSSYGIGKLAIEKYLHLYEVLHRLDYRVLRIANAYGEWQRLTATQGAVGVFTHRALNGLPIEIWGDGSVVRDYIHAGDIASALVLAAAHRGAGRVFNIGSGTGASLNELLAALEGILGRPVERRYAPARAFDVPVNVLDIRRAREELGWTPRVAFADGLRRTVEWQRRRNTDGGGSP